MSEFKKKKANLTGEICPVRGGAVDCAHREAAEPVVVQLPVPHSEAQQHSVYVILGRRLRREKDGHQMSSTQAQDTF